MCQFRGVITSVVVGLKGRLFTTGDIAVRLGGVTRQYAATIAGRKGFPEPFEDWGPGQLKVWRVEDVEAWIKANRPELDA